MGTKPSLSARHGFTTEFTRSSFYKSQTVEIWMGLVSLISPTSEKRKGLPITREFVAAHRCITWRETQPSYSGAVSVSY